jgi:hypothetical protein
MNTFRLIGIVLCLIGWPILVSGIIIPSTSPFYIYSNYTGFKFPVWLYFLASLMATIGGILIFIRSKTKHTPS